MVRAMLVVLVLVPGACAGIRAPWMRQGTVQADPTCQPSGVEETGSYGGGVGPATFTWTATCADGRVLSCSGTPHEGSRGGMETSTCR